MKYTQFRGEHRAMRRVCCVCVFVCVCEINDNSFSAICDAIWFRKIIHCMIYATKFVTCSSTHTHTYTLFFFYSSESLPHKLKIPIIFFFSFQHHNFLERIVFLSTVLPTINQSMPDVFNWFTDNIEQLEIAYFHNQGPNQYMQLNKSKNNHRNWNAIAQLTSWNLSGH